MLGFSTPLSALQANAVALDVVAHNIANANTAGYARQVVHFSERSPVSYRGHLIGQGVQIADIRSTADTVVEKAINTNTSDSAAIGAQLEVATALETLLAPGTGSISDRLASFFDDLERLTAAPADGGARTVVIQSASALADELNRLANALAAMVVSIDQQIQSSLDHVHELSAQLATLDQDIANAESRGDAPLDLVQQRNTVLRALSQEVDADLAPGTEGQPARVRLADGQMSFVTQPIELFAVPLGEKIAVFRVGATGPLHVDSGRLGGLVQARNTMVHDLTQHLDAFTKAFVAAVDAAHAIGVGVGGGLTSVRGSRGVENVNAPLSSSDTIVPVQSGSLFVTVTNVADGSRTLHEVVIDSSQSLADVAAMISGIDGLRGMTDSQSGRLSMLAEPGFTFDFTGGVPTKGSTSDISGTAEIALSGSYEGDQNHEWAFRFVGNGTIGVTEGLSLEVRDESGAVVGVFSVGRDYAPNGEISIGDGIQLRIGSGTVNDGDSFSSLAISRPDQTGLLVALGINTLFSGQNSRDLRLNEAIVNNPLLLATTRSGDPLDTRNAQSLLRLRDQGVLVDGTQSFEVFLANAVAAVGADVSGLTQYHDNLEVVNQSLQAEWLSSAGVDENEEIVHMLQYQRAFQSSARFISAIDETLQELMNIIR